MSYRVQYAPRVLAALDQQVTYLRSEGVGDARVTAWLTELFALTDSLYESPRRHPVAEEETARAGFEIRKMVYGDYLIYYTVDDSDHSVQVVHFRHSAQITNRVVIEND